MTKLIRVALTTSTIASEVRSTDAACKPAAQAHQTSTPLVHPGLDNVFQVAPSLINGSAPHGGEGFAALAAMGVKTIICVDGATPDDEQAKRHGMRYVHLPIGYDGISEAMAATLTRAVCDLPKPIYIHCFHGKHRSPTAAAVAMVGLGRMTNEAALTLIRNAGTSEKYEGLYAAVRRARPFDSETLDRDSADFPAQAALPGFVQAMAGLGRTWDDLKALKAAGWRTLPDHPDLTPDAAVWSLADRLRDLTQREDPVRRPASFRTMLTDAHQAARQLAQALEIEDRALANEAFADLRRSCLACHNRFRD